MEPARRECGLLRAVWADFETKPIAYKPFDLFVMAGIPEARSEALRNEARIRARGRVRGLYETKPARNGHAEVRNEANSNIKEPGSHACDNDRTNFIRRDISMEANVASASGGSWAKGINALLLHLIE